MFTPMQFHMLAMMGFSLIFFLSLWLLIEKIWFPAWDLFKRYRKGKLLLIPVLLTLGLLTVSSLVIIRDMSLQMATTRLTHTYLRHPLP